MVTTVNFKLQQKIIRSEDYLFEPHFGVVVVEYGDFECASCAKAYPDAKRLRQTFSREIQFVFRHFPHPNMHPRSWIAAEAAEAAAAQGQFWEMHDIMFENYNNLEEAQLREYAGSIALDLSRYDKEMAKHRYFRKIQKHVDRGQDSDVNKTPAFFIDGNRVDTTTNVFSDLFTTVRLDISKKLLEI